MRAAAARPLLGSQKLLEATMETNAAAAAAEE
jgi:hypothetical protein